LSHPRFRACYDFFELRAAAGDAPIEVAEWWEKFQFADDDVRETMLLPDDDLKKKRRRKRKKAGDSSDTAEQQDSTPMSSLPTESA